MYCEIPGTWEIRPEYEFKCCSAVLSTIPGVLRIFCKIERPSSLSCSSTNADTIAALSESEIELGCYISGWLGAFPNAGNLM